MASPLAAEDWRNDRSTTGPLLLFTNTCLQNPRLPSWTSAAVRRRRRSAAPLPRHRPSSGRSPRCPSWGAKRLRHKRDRLRRIAATLGPAHYDQPQTRLRVRTSISSPTSRVLLRAEGAPFRAPVLAAYAQALGRQGALRGTSNGSRNHERAELRAAPIWALQASPLGRMQLYSDRGSMSPSWRQQRSATHNGAWIARDCFRHSGAHARCERFGDVSAGLA